MALMMMMIIIIIIIIIAMGREYVSELRQPTGLLRG
jgi:hypothetical protein